LSDLLLITKYSTNENYTEFNFKIQPLEPWNEILMAELIEIGFDSFTEELEGILAYIPTIW
jgi:ribosomal protein L11 methyltransferase